MPVWAEMILTIIAAIAWTWMFFGGLRAWRRECEKAGTYRPAERGWPPDEA